MKIEKLGVKELSMKEQQCVNGGSIFTNIVNWFQKHFFHEKIDEHSWESICKPGYNGTDMYGITINF